MWNATTSLWETKAAPMYASPEAALHGLDKAGGGKNLAVGTVYIKTNNDEATDPIGDFKIHRRQSTGNTKITSDIITTQVVTGTYAFDIAETVPASATLSAAVTISVTTNGAADDADDIAGAINSAGLTNVVASVDASNRIVIEHNDGGDIHITDTNSGLALAGFVAYNGSNAATATPNLYTDATGNAFDMVASNWKYLTYTPSTTAPTALTADGALWYNSIVDEVDMMIHNGTTWVGYQDSTAPFYDANSADKTDPNGPIVSATEPTKQSDDTDLKNGDIWISTADLENYPKVYKYNATSLKWIALDTGDQTTEDGILFADARYGASGVNGDTAATIPALLVSNFLDFDAPDPALYPKGMLLWNTRRSGFNVKKYVRNYIDTAGLNIRFNNDESMAAYATNRWVTESANQENGAGSFGRKAQRKVVVQALQAMVNSNADIRDDNSRIFNLMACPGYSELIGEMVALNNDRKNTAFVIGDTPMRLAPNAVDIANWSNNTNGDGLATADPYLGVYYPAGQTSDLQGNTITVPASHMALRTMIFNDNVAYQWFAPAGTRRGLVDNASSIGYIDSATGEFEFNSIRVGLRDTLYENKINPITNLPGVGLVVFGQKTRNPTASSLDRINVARLVNYIRTILARHMG